MTEVVEGYIPHPVPSSLWGRINLRCFLYYLPECPIRTEVQLHTSSILLHDKPLIPVSFLHSPAGAFWDILPN